MDKCKRWDWSTFQIGSKSAYSINRWTHNNIYVKMSSKSLTMASLIERITEKEVMFLISLTFWVMQIRVSDGCKDQEAITFRKMQPNDRQLSVEEPCFGTNDGTTGAGYHGLTEHRREKHLCHSYP
ncbi:unnamed protein product [Spodoptera exigua]|nr:unnamed protein product [Spodoptera exigua]